MEIFIISCIVIVHILLWIGIMKSYAEEKRLKKIHEKIDSDMKNINRIGFRI